MIFVLYAHIGEKLTRRAWDHYFFKLPLTIRMRISRYLKWEDRQAGLLGKLLLAEALVRHGHSLEYLHNLVWDASGRPFLDDRMDFNISHSGRYVVCAFCPAARVGIDIEEMRPIEISDFQTQMTRDQWVEMMTSDNRLENFFKLWTQKEAVIKADGRGMAIPLDEIAIEEEKAFLAGHMWEVKEVRIAGGYSCHLASGEKHPEIHREQIFFPSVIV